MRTMTVTIFIFVWTVYVLAVMRLTRLVNYDTVLDPIRIRLARRFGPGSTLVYFVGCPWCVSFWIALATAIFPVWNVGMQWWWIFPVALATSMLVGLFAPLSAEEFDIEDQVVSS